jgi:deoxyribonuclease (pyrimidine dimer)
MVRINLINPKYLTDQHLIAEYYELLMLLGYAKKYPDIKDIPKEYCLGKGHIKFFKNKLKYLEKRHKLIREEMKKRGFKPKLKANLKGYSKNLCNNWKPCKKDFEIIKKRIIWKIKLKPKFYRYYGKKKTLNEFIEMTKKAK